MASQLSFNDKKKILFDSLTTAERCIKGTRLEQKEETYLNQTRQNQSRDVSRRFQGKESIFKRPEAPISRCLRPRRVPDHQLNPHKWKRYSLGDTDISDRTNSSAAFAFLAEIEKRKDAEGQNNSDDDMIIGQNSDDKIIFKSKRNLSRPTFNKSVPLKRELERDDKIEEKSSMKGSKVVMPEYVIGQQAQKKIRKKTNKSTTEEDDKQNKLRLQHLFDEEEEDL